MYTLILDEHFDQSSLNPALRWYCPPSNWQIADSHLIITPDARTDFWQKTHYGFSVDQGPFLYTTVDRDFIISTKVRFFPQHQYDQAGLMVRTDANHWIKTSVEYELDQPSKLGAVVTNLGYSDWSTQDYPAGMNEIELRIRRKDHDYIVEYFLPQPASGKEIEKPWTQIRMAHLHSPETAAVQCGLYACSPIEAGYRAEFDYLRIES